MVVITKLDRMLLDFAAVPEKRKDTGQGISVKPAVDAGTISKWQRGGYYVSEAGIERLREIGYDYDEDMEEPGRKTQLGHRVRILTLDIITEQEFWEEPVGSGQRFRLGHLDLIDGVEVRRFRRSLPVHTLHKLL